MPREMSGREKPRQFKLPFYEIGEVRENDLSNVLREAGDKQNLREYVRQALGGRGQNATAFVARKEGRVVGIVTGVSSGGEALLENLFVHPLHRNQDIAFRLVEAASKHFLSKAERVHLNVAKEAGERYEPLGFRREVEGTHYARLLLTKSRWYARKTR